MINIQDALEFKYKGCQYSCGETYESLVWMDEGVAKPTKTKLAAAWKELLAEREKYAYVAKRIAEYPPISEQLDMQFKDKLNGTDTWASAIAIVKAKYPKPE